jgi:hypothetical protein
MKVGEYIGMLHIYVGQIRRAGKFIYNAYAESINAPIYKKHVKSTPRESLNNLKPS